MKTLSEPQAESCQDGEIVGDAASAEHFLGQQEITDVQTESKMLAEIELHPDATLPSEALNRIVEGSPGTAQEEEVSVHDGAFGHLELGVNGRKQERPHGL